MAPNICGKVLKIRAKAVHGRSIMRFLMFWSDAKKSLICMHLWWLKKSGHTHTHTHTHQQYSNGLRLGRISF
jgi:hypothetical protein